MLEIDDLHKRYGDVVALDGCSFRARRGRMLGFLGRNGAGKTTAMRAVFGLLRLDRGQVRWNGRPVEAADRIRFGYMPEERGLYPKMTCRAQLVYVARLHGMAPATADAAARRWLEELGLADRMDDRIEDLSQGNQQRVQLGAAMIHEPELLVLDEPFNGLDPVAAQTMSRVLSHAAARGTAVVFSSHQLEVVEDLCQDVAIIDAGRIAMTGEVEALKADSPHRVVEIDLRDASHVVSLSALSGVVDARFDGRHHVLRVSRDLDLSTLLATVPAGLHVEHFVYTTPSLTDLFTEAVMTEAQTMEASA